MRKLNDIQRSKLIIALQMQDLVGGINLAMRTRKASLELDYSIDHFPRLFLARPGIEREQIAHLDTRKRACYVVAPRNKELHAIYADLYGRMAKQDAGLTLAYHQDKQQRRWCKLQLHVSGANRSALTLMEVCRGNRLVDTSFKLPDGTTP